MKIQSNQFVLRLMIAVGGVLLASSVSAVSLDQATGLSGIADKLKILVETMSGPMAFVLSVAGLLISAAVWKFGGHVAGIKFISGSLAAMIIIANLTSWVSYFTGACM